MKLMVKPGKNYLDEDDFIPLVQVYKKNSLRDQIILCKSRTEIGNHSCIRLVFSPVLDEDDFIPLVQVCRVRNLTFARNLKFATCKIFVNCMKKMIDVLS